MNAKKREAKLEKLSAANTKMFAHTLKEAGELQGLVSALEETETLAVKLKRLDQLRGAASGLRDTAKKLLKSLEKQSTLEAKISKNGHPEKPKAKSKAKGRRSLKKPPVKSAKA